MARRGENIYKRKDGRWEGRYIKDRIDGKIKYGYIFAKTYKEVKKELMVVNNSSQPVLSVNAIVQTSALTDSFSTIADEWFVSQKPQWKYSSIVRYSNILDLYLLPDFAERKISEITRDEVIAFSNKMLVSGGVNGNGLSPKTVSSIISVMKNIFEYATRIKGYSMVDIKGVIIKQSHKPMRILSRIEQQKLSKYLCENMTPCNLGILVCLYTGLRIGEICALKWKDISFDEQYLYVHQTMQRLQTKDSKEQKTAIIISTPKSNCSIRKVPISDNIFGLLKERREQDSAYLLTGKIHSYVEPRTLQNRFKSVARHCSISDVNFHSLRHTFATRCVELGFDIKSLSEILGHASVNITLNRYVHPSMQLKQKNMNLLSELFAVE